MNFWFSVILEVKERGAVVAVVLERGNILILKG